MPRRQATDQERQAVSETLLLRSNRGVLSHGEIGEAAEEFGLTRYAVSRIWERGRATMGRRVAAVVKSRKHDRGRKKVDRVALCERIAQVPVNDRKNQRRIQAGANVSSYLVQQLIKEGYIRRALRQTRPLLTAAHRLARLKFCVSWLHPTPSGYVFDAMLNAVHIDEKWFYVKKVGQKVYVLTGKDDILLEETPVQFCQSKRHIMKVMFLCAVARPRGDWDGKIGLWPVVESYITQRNSINRPAGVEELRSVSITREISRRMLIDDVIPAIKAKWPSDQKQLAIRIQQNNARPHVLEDDAEVRAAGCANGWNITLVNQPAQSPDLNCLDLGLFASIQSLQSRTTSRTIQDIIQEVEHAYEITTAETLNKTFLTLQLVMKEIMSHEGRNDYKLAHLHKDKLIRAGELPMSLQCDTTGFGVAQQSILALAVASWTDPPLPQASSLPSAPSLRSPPPSPLSPTRLDPFLYL